MTQGDARTGGAGVGHRGAKRASTGAGSGIAPRSRAACIVETARVATLVYGRGLTVGELRTAFETATGCAAPASFGAEVSSLVRRGVLARAGGRAGRTLYTPAGLGDTGRAPTERSTCDGTPIRERAVLHHAPDDPAPVVLQALTAAVRASDGAAVATAVVVRALVARGVTDFGSNRVRGTLATLARTRHRGDPAARAPRVLRVGAPGEPRWLPAVVSTAEAEPGPEDRPASADDRPATAASPVRARRPPDERSGAHANDPSASAAPAAAHAGPDQVDAARTDPTHAFPTRAGAVRALVAAAAEAIGRAPSGRELAWFRDGPAAAARATSLAAARCVGIGVARLVSGARDADGAGGAGVERPRGPALWRFGQDGPRASFAADRYTVEEPTAQDHAVLALDAFLDRAKVADEHVAVRQLTNEAERWRSPAMRVLADARAHALRRALADLAVDHDLVHACAASTRALHRLSAWVEQSHGTADVRRARTHILEHHRRHLATAIGMLREDAAPDARLEIEPAGTVRTLGDAAVASHAELAPLARSAARTLELRAELAPRLYGAARRVAPARRSGWAVTDDEGSRHGDTGDQQHPGWIDRVDAVALLVRAIALPRANALVARALDLLGLVVRDATLLLHVLETAPPGRGSVRRAAAVALGLLGVVPPLELVVPDPADPEDVAAMVLAATLGAPTMVSPALQRIRGRTVGVAARTIVTTATGHARTGYLLSVIG